jgi:hypothetical protein
MTPFRKKKGKRFEQWNNDPVSIGVSTQESLTAKPLLISRQSRRANMHKGMGIAGDLKHSGCKQANHLSQAKVICKR